jgi:chemotaxis protein CheX
MTTTFESVIQEIAQTIYSTMLGIDVVRAGDPAPVDGDSLLAAVPIAGQWMGSMVLSMSPDLAGDAAAAMLRLPKQEVTEDDRREVAAELAKMIGGHLKGLLPGPSFLSLPTIVSGRECGLQVHHAELLDDVVLRSASGVARVRLYARQPDAAG